jgi:hypothetical protein
LVVTLFRLAAASRPRQKNAPEFISQISWGAGLRRTISGAGRQGAGVVKGRARRWKIFALAYQCAARIPLNYQAQPSVSVEQVIASYWKRLKPFEHQAEKKVK